MVTINTIKTPCALRKIGLMAASLVSAFMIFIIIMSLYIGHDVDAMCKHAQDKYHLPCVDSLVLLLDNPNESYKDRNSAIWALGQLGNEKSLPTLHKYYTKDIPNKESLEKDISQYELKKAISLASGSTNIARLIWRVVWNKY